MELFVTLWNVPNSSIFDVYGGPGLDTLLIFITIFLLITLHELQFCLLPGGGGV